MNDERALALTRAAERLGLHALRWLPFPDECPTNQLLDKRHADQLLIEGDLEFVRRVKNDVEFGLLNEAEHRGSKL